MFAISSQIKPGKGFTLARDHPQRSITQVSRRRNVTARRNVLLVNLR
jgi:hypothetical protein